MTEPRPKAPRPVHEDYSDPQNILEDLHLLYRDMQPKRGRIFKVAPVAYQLEEGEVVWYDDEAATRRGYVKINGALRFWALT